MISAILLGAGNVATHLSRAFDSSKIVELKQWYNRSYGTIKSYKENIDVIDDLSELKEADIYIFAISDDAISEVSKQPPFFRQICCTYFG